jgi:Fe-S oxidoreductase
MVGSDVARTLAKHAFLFEEFLADRRRVEQLVPQLGPMSGKVLVHGHCHQKAFGAFGAVTRVLDMIPDLKVEAVESSCCGMAGAFGYAAETIDVSLAMGELSLLPQLRAADEATLIVADGTSCRHQIRDGAGREALHVARVLAASLEAGAPSSAALA